MSILRVRPKGALFGTVPISGSKNAALPILAATLLCDGPCVIGNLPRIRDVALTLEILAHMGARVEEIDPHTYRIDPRPATPADSPDPLTEEMRASVYFLGAGLGRWGQAQIGRIGGCDFGGRPIDQHIKAFAALGATVCQSEEGILCAAPALVGDTISFDIVSVGATVNAILAAVRAEGKTVLCNTASEPHIVDLCHFLIRAGAHIEGAGSNQITINGTPTLRGTTYSVLPDMIEAGTYLLAGAITGGAVTVDGVRTEELRALLDTLFEMGADIDCAEHSVSVFSACPLYGTAVTTRPYPGFPTDLQPQMAALFCRIRGEGSIRENVWHNRFRYVGELSKMGAFATVTDNVASFRGAPLSGAEVYATDLRAGAALLLAALAADGESYIRDAQLIDRGYENYVEKLRHIGADVSFTDDLPV